jgi:nicotinate-nucleotide pyrophosphorylase (carboxylating)
LQQYRQLAGSLDPLVRVQQAYEDSQRQLNEALQAGARMVLLDNMSHAQLREAVDINAGRAILEVSGGVNMDTVQAIAATGVDRISIGALTKDIRAVDFSMRMEEV